VVEHRGQVHGPVGDDEHGPVDVQVAGADVFLDEKIIAGVAQVVTDFLVQFLQFYVKFS
jgi:hypothetical protein